MDNIETYSDDSFDIARLCAAINVLAGEVRELQAEVKRLGGVERTWRKRIFELGQLRRFFGNRTH